MKEINGMKISMINMNRCFYIKMKQVIEKNRNSKRSNIKAKNNINKNSKIYL